MHWPKVSSAAFLTFSSVFVVDGLGDVEFLQQCESYLQRQLYVCGYSLNHFFSLHEFLDRELSLVRAEYERDTEMADNEGDDIVTLLTLVTNFPAVHGDLLGEALLLCFTLQESKITVVSSTAAATLRQLVMFVFDKMVNEDRRDDPDPSQWLNMKLPNGTTKSLGPSARDAFSVFEDLCLLANSEKPNFLKLEFLHKTFALKLIESVLTSYHDLFRKHTEPVLLLQLHLCPLFLKQFACELETEAEIFLTPLIKIVADDHSEQPELVQHPQWMCVLAMEIMRGLCSDTELMRNIWARYNAHHLGSNIFTVLITALKCLVTEKPIYLGVQSKLRLPDVAVLQHHPNQ
ncbi:hypothetical protein B0H14DRAFT_3496194 [Mycena olivaceomarginata]|nr:hypothetical protein B0H14DRAFT_3496194 [Mycena olivaceomarginata]